MGLPYAYGAPLAYHAAAAPVVTYAHAPVVYTAAAGCQNEAGAVVPLLTVVSFPSELFQLLLPLLRSLLWRRQGRRGRPRPILKPRPMPGTSTAPTATGPMATATLPTATLLTPTPATTATTAGRRGRRPLRLMPMLLPRPTPGCCMVLTVTDLHMEATTATATTPPTLTLEA